MPPRKRKKHARKPLTTAKPASGIRPDVRSVKTKKLLLVLAVFMCALCVRLIFIQDVLRQDSLLTKMRPSSHQSGFLTNDSNAYITMANNFFRGYFGPEPLSDALLRPPGTGIGLCGLIMSDMLFAVAVLSAVYCLCLGAFKAKKKQVVLSGLLFSAAFLVKPILVFWPFCMIAVYYLFCRFAASKFDFQTLAIAVVIQLLITGLWCTRNYIYDGVFTPSSGTATNLHDYMRPRVEEWAKAGALPSSRAVRMNRSAACTAYMQQHARSSSKGKLQVLNAEAMKVFKAHPLITLRVMLQNSLENMISGWDYLPRQMPLGSGLRRLLDRGVRQECLFRKLSLPVAIVFILCVGALSVLQNAESHRILFFGAAALGVIYSYFALLAGTVFWSGSRIMYPVECILILLICMTVQQSARAARRFFFSAKKTAASGNS